jgi:hypothetical protein
MMMTHSSDAAALNIPVSLNAKDIQIETLEVDFPESSERDASIFGNFRNNIPIRIRFKFLDKSSNNKNISDSLKGNVFLYDLSSNKGLDFGPGDFGIAHEKNAWTRGFYGKNHAARTDAGAGDVSEIVFYVKTQNRFSSQKEFKFGAYLSLTNASTPDNESISSGDKKSVSLTVMPEIDYGNSTAWKTEKEGSEGLPLSGNIETHGFRESNVSGKSTTWQLTHRMLQESSPVRLTVYEAWGGANDMQGYRSAAASALTQTKPGTGNNETTYNDWEVPAPGHELAIRPHLKSADDDDVNVSFRNIISILPASHGLNKDAQSLTLIQLTMTITSDKFNITAYNRQGHLRITDNVGHDQTVRVAGHSEDGKPVISRD